MSGNTRTSCVKQVTEKTDEKGRPAAVNATVTEGWNRAGELIRQARIELGYTNRENFADTCNVSTRVLSDIEAATRTNFSSRVLAGLEDGLGWPAGTIEQLVSDPEFVPPTPGGAGDMVFRPPVFNRRPVIVDVAVCERSIAALTEAHRASGQKPGPTEKALAAALLAQSWPYVLRLLEDNCLPGRELHPAVVPLYTAFSEISDWVSPADPSRRYARWLVGDAGTVDDTIRQRYMQRWSDSRKSTRGRRITDRESDSL
jgi:hypothetical protein